MTSGNEHIVPDFEKTLKLGLNSIIKEVEAELEKIDIIENDGLRKRAFLQSVII